MGRSGALPLICVLMLSLVACTGQALGAPKDWEKTSDQAFEQHRFTLAVRYLDEALSDSSLDADARSHLEAKRRRAQREADRERLAELRVRRDNGAFAIVLRNLPRSEDPELRREEHLLMRECGELLAARKEIDPVLEFLRDEPWEAGDAECVAARRAMWRAVAPGLWNRLRRLDHGTPDLVHALAFGESLMIYAQPDDAERTALANARQRAGEYFAHQAALREERPCAELLHLSLAEQFGVTSPVERASVVRAVENSLRLGWRVEVSGKATMPQDLITRVRGLLPSYGQDTVLASLLLTECGPGTDVWEEEVSYIAHERGPTRRVVTQVRPSGTVTRTVTTPSGEVVTRTYRVPGQRTTRTVESEVTTERTAMEEHSAPAYLVRGEVTFKLAEHSCTLPLDVHPRWPKGLPSGSEQLRDAAVELAASLQDGFREAFTGHAEAALQRALGAAQSGNDAAADEEFVLASLLYGHVPPEARDYFNRRYGISESQLAQAIRLH